MLTMSLMSPASMTQARQTVLVRHNLNATQPGRAAADDLAQLRLAARLRAETTVTAKWSAPDWKDFVRRHLVSGA